MISRHRALIAAAAGATLAGNALAVNHFFEATINGDQENPPVVTSATGTLSGVYDDVANTFSFSWEIVGPLNGDPSAPGAHIHDGDVGDNGPIVFAMSSGVWNLVDSDVWSGLSTAEVDDLFAGGLYANFHTSQHAGGEVRGQITLVPSPATAAIGVAGMGLAGVTRRRRA